MQNKITLCLAVSLLGYLSLGANSEINSHIGEKVSRVKKIITTENLHPLPLLNIETKIQEQKTTFKLLKKQITEHLLLPEKIVKKFDKELIKNVLLKNDKESLNLLIVMNNFNEDRAVNAFPSTFSSYQKLNNKKVYFENGKIISQNTMKKNLKSKNKVLQEFMKKVEAKQKMQHETLLSYMKKNKINYTLSSSKDRNSYLNVKMTKKQLAKFSNINNHNYAAIGIDGKHTISTTADALLSTNIDPVVTTWQPERNNQRGNGIGIYYSDAFCPAPELTDGDYVELIRDPVIGNNDLAWHTEAVTQFISAASPEAFKYCKNTDFSNNYPGTLPTRDEIFENNQKIIQVESYSINRNNADDNNYTAEDMLWDNHVVTSNNLVFNSAGNHDFNSSTVVESPAKAYNIITIGNYYFQDNRIWVRDEDREGRELYSNYSNPTNGNEKPEIVAPGTDLDYNFHFPDGSLRQHVTGIEFGTGTSYATPIAAGIAADIMSENPFLQNNVMTAKAMMLASAINNITDVQTTEGDSAVGAGGINIEAPIYQDYGAGAYFDPHGIGSITWDNDFSCYDGWKFSIPSSHSMTRVALTWEIDGQYALENADMGTVLYFYVVDNASQQVVTRSWLGSDEFPNNNSWKVDNWAVADFNPSGSGMRNYTLHACRFNRESNNKNAILNMGYAVTSR